MGYTLEKTEKTETAGVFNDNYNEARRRVTVKEKKNKQEREIFPKKIQKGQQNVKGKNILRKNKINRQLFNK